MPAPSNPRPAPHWPGTPAELACAQEQLAASRPAPWRPAGTPAVGGCWVCFPRGFSGAGARGEPAWAAAVVPDGGRPGAAAVVAGRAGAPYAPGLLALREGPLLEDAVRALARRPDVLLVNATGRDHPRGAGLALQLGAVLGVPTIGVTDRPLVAADAPPGHDRGDRADLRIGGEVVACRLRTRAGARPLVVHPGWRTDPQTAAAVVLAACRGRRTPEPLRLARRLAREARAGARAARTLPP